jgi:hypothetical protein
MNKPIYFIILLFLIIILFFSSLGMGFILNQIDFIPKFDCKLNNIKILSCFLNGEIIILLLFIPLLFIIFYKEGELYKLIGYCVIFGTFVLNYFGGCIGAGIGLGLIFPNIFPFNQNNHQFVQIIIFLIRGEAVMILPLFVIFFIVGVLVSKYYNKIEI